MPQFNSRTKILPVHKSSLSQTERSNIVAADCARTEVNR